MAEALIIVESPAKARTISRFLGSDYTVESSIGHIRDLPSNATEIPARLKNKEWARLGVDVESGFTPVYVVPASKKSHVAKLKKHLAKARSLLSTPGDQQQFYSECERALSGFAADKVNVARAGMMTDDVGRLLETKGVANNVIEDYLECLRVCEMKRFSPVEAGSHEGEAFLKRAETAIQQLDEAIST